MGQGSGPKSERRSIPYTGGAIHDPVNGRSSTNGLRVTDTGENGSSSHATLVANPGESGQAYWRNDHRKTYQRPREPKVRRWPQHSHSLQKGPEGAADSHLCTSSFSSASCWIGAGRSPLDGQPRQEQRFENSTCSREDTGLRPIATRRDRDHQDMGICLT